MTNQQLTIEFDLDDITDALVEKIDSSVQSHLSDHEFEELSCGQSDEVRDICDEFCGDKGYVTEGDVEDIIESSKEDALTQSGVEDLIDQEVSAALEDLQLDICTLWESRLSSRIRRCWESQRRWVSAFFSRFRKDKQ